MPNAEMSSLRGKRIVDATNGKESEFHRLPLKIEYDGPAPVSSLFSKYTKPHPTLPNVVKNSFRGRPLLGKEFEPPPGCNVYFVRPSRDGETMRVESKVGRGTVWEWDKPPSTTARFSKIKHWIGLAKVLQDPIVVSDSDPE